MNGSGAMYLKWAMRGLRRKSVAASIGVLHLGTWLYLGSHLLMYWTPRDAAEANMSWQTRGASAWFHYHCSCNFNPSRTRAYYTNSPITLINFQGPSAILRGITCILLKVWQLRSTGALHTFNLHPTPLSSLLQKPSWHLHLLILLRSGWMFCWGTPQCRRETVSCLQNRAQPAPIKQSSQWHSEQRESKVIPGQILLHQALSKQCIWKMQVFCKEKSLIVQSKHMPKEPN